MKLKKMITLFFAITFMTVCVLTALLMTGCNQEFYSFAPSIPENPLKTSKKLPPYDWSTLSRKYDQLEKIKITSHEHNQHSPDMYENKIVYIDQRWEADEIYMYDLQQAQESRLTSRSSLPQNKDFPIKKVKIYKDAVIWQEENTTEKTWDIYSLFLGQSTPQKIISLTSNPNALQMNDNALFWSVSVLNQPPEKREIFFYNFLNRKTQQLKLVDIPFINTFQINHQWLIFTDSNYPSPTSIYAYHLFSGEQFRLNSPQTRVRNLFYIDSQNTVYWIDNRYTKSAVYSYNLNNGSHEQEKLYLIFNLTLSGNSLYSIENDVLCFHEYDSSLYVADLGENILYQEAIDNIQNVSVQCKQGQCVFHNNDSLIKGNNDIFLYRVKR